MNEIKELTVLFEILSRKKFFLRLKDVYYAPQINRKEEGYDAVYYFNCHEKHEPSLEHITAVNDLTLDEAEILGSFGKKTRQEINKMLKDEKFSVQIIENPDVPTLESFLAEYDRFTQMKGFYPSNRKRVYGLHNSNRLVLFNADYDDERILQTLLIEDEDRGIAYYGYTIRLKENDARKLRIISGVNKAVVYRCMLYWKEKGKKYYDIGGLSLDPDNPSARKVDHFKEAFHGEQVLEYEFIYPLTWKGHLLCWLKQRQRDIRDRKKKRNQQNLTTNDESVPEERMTNERTQAAQSVHMKPAPYEVDKKEL